MYFLLLLAHGVAAPPKLSVCTRGVCCRYGAFQVLEAAQALAAASGSDLNVAEGSCTNACRDRNHNGVSTWCSWNKSRIVLANCAEAPSLALAHAVELMPPLDEDAAAVRAAFTSKLAGDAALDADDPAAAVAAYGAAIDGAPAQLVQIERSDPAAVATAIGAAAPPPKLKGLPPMQRDKVLTQLRERTRPGRIRWLFEARVGRCRAALQLGGDGGAAGALSDAREATALCPLAPAGWAALGEAAEACGDDELAGEARATEARLTPAS